MGEVSERPDRAELGFDCPCQRCAPDTTVAVKHLGPLPLPDGNRLTEVKLVVVAVGREVLRRRSRHQRVCGE